MSIEDYMEESTCCLLILMSFLSFVCGRSVRAVYVINKPMYDVWKCVAVCVSGVCVVESQKEKKSS
jgi:hypothetical protein